MQATRSLVLGLGLALLAMQAGAAEIRPWMDPKLDPDERARLVEREMTLDERIGLLHGVMAFPFLGPLPPEARGSAGYIPGVPRLGVPALQESDASLGLTNPLEIRKGEGGTPMPSGLALAATFDPDAAFQGGRMIGHEAWSAGFNVLLGGGVNLTREPRGGRSFEYLGEDPLLAGTLAGEAVRGTQSQHVISTVKHFVLNSQETLRHAVSANIPLAALRESDLLAFELAIERGEPGAVMCSYNRINGDYACDNDRLLNGVLKGDWGYRGWVMSDWGAVPGLQAAIHGLDQQSGQQLDKAVYFGAPLKAAVESGTIPPERVSDMTRRILRSMFAVGVVENPPQRGPVDYDADAAVAQRAAEEGIVLLKNQDGLLPLASKGRRVLLIGGFADVGVLSGGGSSQVIPPGAVMRVPVAGEGELPGPFRSMVFHLSSPLKALRAAAPDDRVSFFPGDYPAAAAAAAHDADVAIVFATQWTTEGADVPDLTLPNGQDQLIAAVAAANPNTIVVLETGGPVLMPWLGQVKAVIEAWYPGVRGGEALARILTGQVNPSGHLPITFPAGESQLPQPVLPGAGRTAEEAPGYDVAEGADSGYRWYARQGLEPLFPFGHGLSYTSFGFAGLALKAGDGLELSFDVTNTGSSTGAEVPQAYLVSAAGKPTRRLIGFARISLAPGETGRVTMTADPRLLGRYDESRHGWWIEPGVYRVAVGASSKALSLQGDARLKGGQVPVKGARRAAARSTHG